MDIKKIDDSVVCPICFGANSKDWIYHEETTMIVTCQDCGCGYVSPYLNITEDSYSDYGDYLTTLSDNYFENRKRVSKQKWLFFSVLKLFKGTSIKVLDYGGGAGFFILSALKMGFEESFLFEPSKNFRRAAKERVGIAPDKVKESINEIDFKLDFVSMLDVIEHLPEDKIHQLLSELRAKLNKGAVLFGETPNKNSINILLHRERDPAISPPGHVLYFTKNSLDNLLRQHGFKRILLITKGFSTNSFFRSVKHEPSKVEMPVTKIEKLLSRIIKSLFGLISLPLSFFGLGYHLVFIYKLTDD